MLIQVSVNVSWHICTYVQRGGTKRAKVRVLVRSVAAGKGVVLRLVARNTLYIKTCAFSSFLDHFNALIFCIKSARALVAL